MHKDSPAYITIDGGLYKGPPFTLPIWAIVLIIIGSFAIVVGLGVFIFMRRRNKQLAAGLQQYNELSQAKEISL